MPQKTNLNINPYYDDFDKNDNFYRVLFKPGYPVQARELTTLQSILQNQIESFGSHIFKDGSMVIPGGVTYDRLYNAVKLNPQHFGIDISIYLNSIVGKKITGAESGVTASVQKILLPPDLDIEYPTIYVKYINANIDLEPAPFNDGETLILQESITYGNTTLQVGDSFASCVDSSATSVSSAVHVSEGVYFIRGTFVQVQKDTIILDPYSNSSSYRVGFNISEELISSGDDSSLYDNARGFSNYAAPGADRLKISTVLAKKVLTDFDDKNFIELVRIDNGEIKKLQDKSTYSIIKDYFAKRTFEESGDYSVGAFGVELAESLNDRLSNGGIYNSDQKTEQNNTPSDDLVCVKISPGKAYVRGYDIDFPGTTILDVEKPRDLETVTSASIPFEMGNLVKVNNVRGCPFVGLNNNNNYVDLQTYRKTSNNAASGETIGRARVYSFSANSDYVNESSAFNLYLFDVQTYTKITLNELVFSGFCPATSYIRGLSSGASGYLVQAPGPSGTTGIYLSQTSGNFIVGEQVLINESSEYRRSIVAVETNSIKDIKSVYQSYTTASGITTDFSADTILDRKIPTGFSITDTITVNSIGIATCAGKTFSGISTNTIIRYQRPGFTTETYNRVTAVSTDLQYLYLTGVSTVFGVCDGGVPGSGTVDATFTIGLPKVQNEDNAFLYAKLSSPNVSTVDLNSSTVTIVKQVNGQSTSPSGNLSLNTNTLGFSSAFFEPYDSDRYSIIYNDGAVEQLTSDQVSLSANNSQINFTGLRSGIGSVTVNTTIKRQAVKSKRKDYIRSAQIIVSSTSSGVSTSISGLSTSPYYGLRVEDREISLNVPDAVKLIAVYESLSTSTPTLDTLQFVSGLGLDINAIIGEKITGSESGSVAQIVNKPSSTDIQFVYLNSNKFVVGELVTFSESNIQSSIQAITSGSYLNITDRYSLDKGQKEQYYDYSRIVRNRGTVSPSRKLLIIFDKYVVPSNDTGDFYTVNSYDKERYTKDIPILANNTRASDVIDFRPRVSDFTSTSSSPFDFSSRTFGSSSVNTNLVVSPNESSILGYKYYLSRVDKVVLDKQGNISVVKGTSSTPPKEPVNVEEAMTIATISYPPYLYNVKDASINLIDNRRYTMRDIGKLEDRIETLETVTSLSLLELNTKSLQIQDADGLSRFKSGFFVDDFSDNGRMDLTNFDSKSDVDTESKELKTPTDFYSLKLEPALSDSINSDTADFSSNLALLDPNVKKTGDLITLNYEEKEWIQQPLASRVENVNPFQMVEYIGRVILSPASDNWVRNVYVPGGTRTITGGWNGSYIDNVLISSEPDTYMRSRNVQFASGGLKPLGRYYPFLDGISGIDVVPKLLEIEMQSGTFSVGETVDGFVGASKLITFRTARPDHKSGPYLTPTTTYNSNPYNTSLSLSTQYSASATVLNIDIASLSEEVLGKYSGYVTSGMTLVGQTSGATCIVSNIRLVADTFGDLIGSFFIRDPLTTPPPSIRIQTGSRTFKLTTSSTNATPLPGSLLISSGETTYSASGIVDTYRQDTVIVRTPPPPPPNRGGGKDPLAQSFTVDETGAFLTAVDLYFASKDENEKCYVEVRDVELGTPTDRLVQDFARVILEPSQIGISSDASVATKVTFPSPIYLQPQREYAIVVLAPTTNNYELWVARMGEKTVNGQNLPDAESVMVTKQYIGGSLFKSQNGTIWTASQFEDLKFKLYKAKFTSQSGSAFFYNPKLEVGDSNIQKLIPDSIRIFPRKINVGITTVYLNSIKQQLVPGKRVKASTSLANGYIERVGGGVSFTGITTISTGAGYSGGSYPNVRLYPITGNGSDLIAQSVSFFNTGKLNQVVINTTGIATGKGFSVGDVVGVVTADVGNSGTGARLSISGIDGYDTLYLTNVQGDNFLLGGSLQVYTNDTTQVSYANTVVITSTAVGGQYSGNVLEVTQFNHGMTSNNNKVTISGVKPNTNPTSLTVDLDITDTTISLANTTGFSRFEGITTAFGYLKVNNEVIYYNSIGSGVLGIATRGVDGTAIRKHYVNDPVYKYEIGDVSLTRVNKTHDMSSDATLRSLNDIDSYNIEIDRGSRSTGESQLNFSLESQVGGDDISVSQNIQYNSIIPQFNVITPGQSSSVSGSIRTVSGTSAGGSEVSFLDNGFEAVQLNQINDLSSPRIVCSRINETTRLTTLPKNRSLTVNVSMKSNDPNLSPAIDTQTAFVALGRNRLNNPILDYANDSRVNQLSGDPHSAIYVSQRVNLSQPATSLKVFVSAYRDSSADFRVLYRLFKADSSEIAQSYNLFPGYDNLTDTNNDGFGDTIVNEANNNGKPDKLVRSSRENEFIEYQFSVDDLEQFTGYSIKIVMSGTNEAKSPKFKDIRAIALA
jgi:hypothetical protein